MNVELLNVSKSYGSNQVLGNLNISIEPGITAIIGLNGSGKSSLLKVLSGLVHPDSGEISLSGEKVDLRSISWKKVIGYLPQDPPFYERMTLVEFLDYILLLSKWKQKSERSLRINEVIEVFGLEGYAAKPIGHLSGGIRQRIAISQAIIHNPSILLLDEPTNNLDIEGRMKLSRYLLMNSAENIVLYVGHVFEELRDLCSKIIVMDNSKIVFYDATENLISNYLGIIKEVHIDSKRFSEIKNHNVSVVNVINNNSSIILRYDSSRSDSLGGTIVRPTLREAFQCLINYYISL